MPDLIGDTLGPYRILETIDGGGAELWILYVHPAYPVASAFQIGDRVVANAPPCSGNQYLSLGHHHSSRQKLPYVLQTQGQQTGSRDHGAQPAHG